MPNQTECSRLEHKSVFLVAEKCKLYEIYIRMCDVYEEASFYLRNVYKWTELLKAGQNSNQDEEGPGIPTIASAPEIEDLVNIFILAGLQ